jgi:hypothetical protein
MCYHNIKNNEKIFDFKATEEKLFEILHANMRAAEPRRVRMEMMAAREQEWENTIKEYCARVIQRLAREYLARKIRRRDYWRVAIVLKGEMEELEAVSKHVRHSLGGRFRWTRDEGAQRGGRCL